MKITITGSLGHIGKPLTQTLVKEGHAVTVITSKSERQKDIEALGAVPAVGTLEDVDFLAAAFAGTDAVYTMVPPANYFDHSVDVIPYFHRLGQHYAAAIQRSGVKRVVNLSTIGGEMEKGSGLLLGAHQVEKILDALPDVIVTQMRPTAFYYNLYAYAGTIKKDGIIATNYGTKLVPWVSPLDIAAAVAEELTRPVAAQKVRYVASEELTGAEVASILGKAIGKPDLRWVIITDDEMQHGLEAVGMNPTSAAGLVEMYASLQNGELSADYFRHRPTIMGKVKMADFAKEFAAIIKQNI
ncbi:NmrA family NAD(P)-binding protein [Chryseolinea sp. H1M3-3]|uniref:NmrA family NAD(P)-binding protein n=1 Tax=Chryseolinea sp. H1M3-3 TaxID=3034144 RepID=UPI0023EDF496|nr:NmrA family NAD(P)-binding protein [Chryseolinea sp. H1M3-3]